MPVIAHPMRVWRREEERRGEAVSAGLSAFARPAGPTGRTVREHRPIGNRLRRVLDVVFHEDLGRFGSGNGPQTVATTRHTAPDLLRRAEDEHGLEVRRTSAAWDDADLDAIIRQDA